MLLMEEAERIAVEEHGSSKIAVISGNSRISKCIMHFIRCYLHFALENPEDGKMFLLVLAHPGCPGQSPERCKMVVCVVCRCQSQSILTIL